jgi:hypothetical protein
MQMFIKWCFFYTGTSGDRKNCALNNKIEVYQVCITQSDDRRAKKTGTWFIGINN